MPARLVEPFHDVRSSRVRTLDQQVDLAGEPDLFANCLSLDERGIVRGDQLRGVGFDLDRGKGGPTGQPNDQECDHYWRRQPSHASDATARGRPESATLERPRNASAKQQEQWQADQVVRQAGHHHAQRHEEPELADQRNPRRDEGQHPGSGGGRGQSRVGQNPARRQREALLQRSLTFHHPIHRLDQVVGGQPEHDWQHHQRCGRDRQAEEAGDARSPERTERGNQNGEQHRGAQGKEGDDKDRNQRQRNKQRERTQDGISYRKRERW